MEINIKELIDNLAQTAEQLIEKQIIPDNRFEYFFEGDEEFFYKPESGVRLVFDDASKQLKSVQFTLINVYDSSGVYSGEMPYPFLHSMDRAIVRALMGEPDSVGSPEKIPVIGIVGGYDAYTHKLNSQYPNTEIRFLYLADLRVHALIFEHFL
ncbi:hypothetical protein TI10_10705 [Photorhabdus luminescens subsp. luminescens]|uniref:Uncharacterized protein n=1 Tax=Photorhabdus luminescens TaxID=29488 RepID=A0A1G5QJS2_PHOLU|nr:DUF6392 family protein [Photorhabdus luminescens]KMW73605.1 hypothetical protein TI10_10705 [Photorhabdus luminescens subsp. luminescens]SCZ62064.1 hypothetical protein SAMN02982990_01835 [Photorhabdus luminescens]